MRMRLKFRMFYFNATRTRTHNCCMHCKRMSKLRSTSANTRLAAIVPTKGFSNASESATSSSSVMYRTGSAGNPSLPESPLATSKAAKGVAPSPLTLANQRADFSQLPAIQVEEIVEEEAAESPLIYPQKTENVNAGKDSPLWNFQVGQLQAASSSNLLAFSTISLDLSTENLSSRSDIDLSNSTINLLAARDSNSSLLGTYNILPTESITDILDLAGSGGDDQIPAERSAVDLTRSSGQKKRQWMEVQITTFTNWVNDRLKPGKHDRKVDDLSNDLKDGILLIKLLENLTKKKVKGFTGKTPKTEAHKLVNLDLAFQFMQSEDIKMIGVGGINIYQGNMTLTLGMIWMLIQKYQIRMQGYKVSTKNVMVNWLQALLPRWNITNLTSDWKDGRALIAAINKVKPGIAPNVATLNPTKHRYNCTLAIKVANSYLKIPKIISPDDLSSGNADELSMMTYLSYFVDPFRIKLLKWIRKVIPLFNITGFSTDWYDGRAFGALLNACFPGSFTEWATLEMDTSKEFIDQLFKITQKKFGIMAPFDSEDLADGKVEELQVMTMIMLVRGGEMVSLPNEVIISGPGSEEAQLQKETHFTINTTEAGPGQLYIDAYFEEDGKKLKFSLKEERKRVVRLLYIPLTPGNIIFDVTWSDIPVPGCPFSVPVIDSALVNIVNFESHNRLVEIGKPVSLTLETKQAGFNRLTAFLQQGKEKIPAKSTTLSANRVQLEYTPSKSGTAVLHIFWNKEELIHLSVTYTVVDSGGYSIEAYPKDKLYCSFDDIRFCVLSAKGLPLDVLQMTAILNEDVQIPLKFTQIDGNRGFASFIPSLAGSYSVEVVCVDQLIRGTPFSVKVTDPHGCKIEGEIPLFLELGKPHVFQVDTKEAGIGSITFESSDHDISSLFKTKLQLRDSSDLQKLQVTPIVEGDYIVGIQYQKRWISGCPFRLQICDPSKFDIVEKPKVGNVGKPIEFKVHTKKQANNDNLKLVVKADGPSAKYSPQTKVSEDGLSHSISFVPWEIGDHKINIRYGEFDIPSSPIVLPVVLFDYDACSAAGAGLQKAYTNKPAQFVVLSRQHGLIEDGTLQIKVASVINKSEGRIRARDNKDGTYSIAYLIQKTGAYLISVQAAGEHIPGSPFKMNALPGPEAHKCKMYGPALNEESIFTFGKPIEFTVDTEDAGTGKLLVNAIGPGGTKARIFIAKTDHPGRYDINIDALRHGKHRVSVKWSGQHIPCSPFILKVFPGADARKCNAYGSGLEDGLVSKASSFIIETKNAGAGILKVRLHGLKGAFKIEIQPKDQKDRRTLLAKYDPTQPGEYLITIKWSDVHIPGSPFRVKIVGDGVEKRPVVFTPTPRLPEMATLIDEAGDRDFGGDAGDDRQLAPYKSAPALLAGKSKPATHIKDTFNHGFKDRASHKKSQDMTTFHNLQQYNKQNRRRRVSLEERRKDKKKEFDGQVTIRMQNLNKSKFVSK